MLKPADGEGGGANREGHKAVIFSVKDKIQVRCASSQEITVCVFEFGHRVQPGHELHPTQHHHLLPAVTRRRLVQFLRPAAPALKRHLRHFQRDHHPHGRSLRRE